VDAGVGFYGSILAGLILYAAFSRNPDANSASGNSASKALVAKAPQELASARARNAMQRGLCGQVPF